MTAPGAGWHPDHDDPNLERFWDGSQWTDQRRPVGATQPPPPPMATPASGTPSGFASQNILPGAGGGSSGDVGRSKADAKAQAAAAKAYSKSQQSWFARHKILTCVGALVAVIIIASAAGGGSKDNPSNTASNSKPTGTQTTGAQASIPTTAAATQAPRPAAPAETSSQRNAKRAAANYLSFAPFSRKGLIRQLSSSAGDGYSIADATYGVDALHANWREQAVIAARNYLKMTPMSRSGLIQQLESSAGDQYTHAEAVYGADKALAE